MEKSHLYTLTQGKCYRSATFKWAWSEALIIKTFMQG